ncbi:unnamed protein product [Psylliodes chrysocephalus]|uniref:Uncharacterized protein n=1 Tax=Psylliodes chrysocephalus TaxID=3402493 RepID=A0A9P0GB30_9CUCU|nr:unnamed protein product [Psylliodes chrysocephala]
MGNSGSQNTVTETIQEEQWAHSFPRSCSSQTKFHFQHKVLPEKRPQLKLRATNNGEILQSGGTISGRHVKSAEEERIKRYLQTFDERNSYEQNEYEKDNHRKIGTQGVQHKLSNSKLSSQEMKFFASEPDLRYALTNDEFREKRSKKKYRAPSPPKMRNIVDDYKISRRSSDDTDQNPKMPIRKARLFKTRAETKKQSSHPNENTQDDLSNLDCMNVKTNLKRLSLPEGKVMDFNEFTRELKDATQRRSVDKHLKNDSNIDTKIKNLSNEASREEMRFKENKENQLKSVVTHIRGEASGKESSTPEMSPDLQPKYQFKKDSLKPKQVFYFGMNEGSRENLFKEDIFDTLDAEHSSGSDISSDIDSDENDTFRSGIDLQLRPILPKKQLEIPRFSPAAAWRLLSLDANDEDSKTTQTVTTTVSGSGAGIEGVTGFGGTIMTDDVPLFMEEHIEKYSRPLPLLLNAGQRSCNDKSGDSGISGDDAVPIVYCYDDDDDNIADNDDRVSKLRINENKISIHTKTERERISWTPQQDLDDSSAEEELFNKPQKQRTRTHAGPHVFSLSLPRENHLATYMTEKVNSSHYNGIQKFKKSLSGVWGNLANKKDIFNNSFLEERSNNWFLSKSAPNSLTNAIHSLERHKTLETHQSSNINTANRLMYLPEIDFVSKNTSKQLFDSHSNYKRSIQSKSCENIALEVQKKSPEPLQDPKPKSEEPSWNIKRKPKKYTFQSTIRQIEKKRLSDKLSKEAEKRERERIRELDAMQKVEEEFQRKRAMEKATIQQQLRLYSLDENTGCQSLPNFEIKNKNRSEPDGAFSSVSSSSSSSSSRKNDYLKKKTVNQHKASNCDNKLMASSTKELSEFRQIQRDYKDYNSNLMKHHTDKRYFNRQTTIHPQVSCTMSQVKGLNKKQNHNYRKEFASGIRSVSNDSSRSETSQNYRKKQLNNPIPSNVYNNYFIPL